MCAGRAALGRFYGRISTRNERARRGAFAQLIQLVPTQQDKAADAGAPSAFRAIDAARGLSFCKAVRAAHRQGTERSKSSTHGGPRADALLGERF